MRAAPGALAACLLLAATSCLPAAACIVRRDSLEAARAKSNAALVGTVRAALPGSEAALGKTFRYRLALGQVLAGEVPAGDEPPGGEIRVHHFQGNAFLRGEKLVCPVLSGSGLEGSLAPGETYVLLLRTDPLAQEGSLEMIRAEPLASLTEVAALFGVDEKPSEDTPSREGTPREEPPRP